MAERLQRLREQAADAHATLQGSLQDACKRLEELMHLQDQAMECLAWAVERQQEAEEQLHQLDAQLRDTEVEEFAKAMSKQAQDLCACIMRQVNAAHEALNHETMIDQAQQYSISIDRAVSSMKQMLKDEGLGKRADWIKEKAAKVQAHKALLTDVNNNEAPPNPPGSASKRAQQTQQNGGTEKQDVIEIESEAEGAESDDSDELEVTGAPETVARPQQHGSCDGANGHEDRHPLFTECKFDSDDERTELPHKSTPPRFVRDLSTVVVGRRPSDPRLSAKRKKDRLQWIEDTPPSEEDETAAVQPLTSTTTTATTTTATTTAAASSYLAEYQPADPSPPGPAVGPTSPKSAEQTMRPAESSEDELEAELNARSESEADDASTTKRKSPPRRRRSSPINRHIPSASKGTEPAMTSSSSINGSINGSSSSNSNHAAEQLRKKRKAAHDSLQDLQRSKEELVDLT